MRRIALASCAVFALFASSPRAHADVASATVVATCGTQSFTAGANRALSQDTTGALCSGAGGGGGSSSGGGGASAPFLPTGANVTLTAGVVSSNVAIGTSASTLRVYNTGTKLAYCTTGVGGGATATTSSLPIPAGSQTDITLAGGTFLACITSSGTSAIVATPGTSILDTINASLGGGGLAPTVAYNATSLTLKGSPGTFWSAMATANAVNGYLLVENLAAAPGDGAVTPLYCVTVPANSSRSISFPAQPPATFSTGITLVFSTTGCSTQTTSVSGANAFLSGMAQ